MKEIKGRFLIQNPAFSDIKSVYYITITVGKVSSHEKFAKCRKRSPQVFCMQRETSALESFDEVVRRRPQAYYFI